MQMFKKGKLKLLPSFKGAFTSWRIFRRVKRIEKQYQDGPAVPGKIDLPAQLYSAYLNALWQPQLTPQFGADLAFRAGVYEVAAAHWQRMLTSDSDSTDAASLRRTARSTLAYLKYNGLGVPQDRQSAVDDWTIAANEGAIEARRQLGFAYSDPEFAGRNNVVALAWYQSLVLAIPEPDSLDSTDRAVYDDALAGIGQLESGLTELEISVARERAREFAQ